MATALKAEAQKSSIDQAYFKGQIKDIRRHKAEAKDKNGLAGQATALLVDNTQLDRRAIGFGVQLFGMESAKRAALVQDMMTVLKLLDFLDEPTLFGTPAEQGEKAAQEIVKAAGASAPATGSAPPPPAEEDEFEAANPAKATAPAPADEAPAAAPRGRGRPKKDEVKAAADRAEKLQKANMKVVGGTEAKTPGVSGTDLQAQIDKAGMTEPKGDAKRPGFH